jgi:hypothetical protein
MTAHMARSMVSAEFLKLRRRRGILWWSLLLTSGAMVAAFTTLVILHLNDPGHYGPAGGARNFTHAMEALIGLGGVASIMIGASAGAGDLGAGVFRDMASSGRSRITLFLVRVPGALLLQLPLILGAVAIAAVASIVLAGGEPVPTATLIAQYGGWVLAGTVLELILAIGLSSLLGTRATTIGVLLAWELIGARLLQSFTFLGDVRKALNSTAIDNLRPGGSVLVPMSVVAAIIVAVCWALVALAAGAWRTRTIDA